MYRLYVNQIKEIKKASRIPKEKKKKLDELFI